MEKNFTQLIHGLTQTKKFLIALTSLIILAGSVYLFAAIVAITPQTVVVSADTAVGGPSAGFTVLNPIVILEGNQKDFPANSTGSFTLTAPNGWAFRQSGVNVNITAGEQTPNVSHGTVTYTSTAITIPITVIGENRVDRIEISGVALQALTGTAMTARAVTMSLNGFALSGFNSPTTFANISQTHGSARNLAFGVQPSATDIYTAISPAPTVLIQDWAGNTVTNASGNVTVALGNNPSNGVLSGTTTVAASSGVATFSNLRLDASGSNYTLVASRGSLTSATSSAFAINSATPVLDEVIAGCYTIGMPEQVITLRGSNFARNATGRIGSSARPTTFVSPTELRMTLLESDMAVAGNKAINVLNPNPSAAASASISVIVYNIFENIAISGSRDVCTNASANVGYSGPNTTAYSEYEWFVSEGATIFSGQGTRSVNIRYADQAPASGKVIIRVKALNGCGIAGEQTFEVNVRQSPPTTITHETPLIFCEGGSVVLQAPVAQNGEAAYTYQWRRDGSDIEGEESATFEAKLPGSYTVVLGAENACSRTSAAVVVSTTTALIQESITGSTAYCQGSPATALSAVVSGGLVNNTATVRARSFTWEQSLSATGGPWTVVQGPSSTATFIPSTATAGTFYYRRTVTAGGCEDITEPIAVTITPAITNEISGAQTVCSGETIDPIGGTYAGGAPGEVSFLWQQSPNGTNTWTDAPGANTGESYTPTTEEVTATKATWYRRIATSGNCVSNSNTVRIQITARPLATITQGANTYFCPPGGATLTATSVSGATYAWFRVGQTDVLSSARSTTVNEVGEYYVEVTANNCTSKSANILVQQTVVGNNILNSADQVVCYGAIPDILLGTEATSTLGEVIYQWQSSTNGTTFSSITTGGDDVNLELGAHTANRWYRRLATVGSCTVTSEPIAITVKPELRVTNLPTTTPAICNNAAFSLNPAASVPGATVAWSRTAVEGISNAAGSGTGPINEVLTNTTDAPINVVYEFITSGNEDCTGVAQYLSVRVNPTPRISNLPVAAAICSGTAFDYTATNAVSGTTTWSWERKPAAGISSTATATTGTTARINQVLINETGQPIDVTYTYSFTTNGCTNTQDVVVTVNPKPIAKVSSSTVCSGTAATVTATVTNAVGPYTYTWTVPSNATNPGNVASFETTVGGTYSVIITDANNCVSVSAAGVVTVNALPAATITTAVTNAPLIFCDGGSVTLRAVAAPTGQTYEYQWYVGNTAITEGGNSRDYIARTSGNYTVKVTNVATGCNATTATAITVTVNPLPTKPVITGLPAVIYTLDAPVQLQASPSNSGGRFTLRRGTTVINTNATTISPCTLGAGNYSVTYTYGNGTCNNTSDPVAFTIRTTTYTAVNFAEPFPVCKGQNTEFKAILYRDVIVVPVTDARHPDHGQWLNETYAFRKDDPKRYWQDFVGVEPLDANGKLQPAPASLIVNQEDLDAGNDTKNYKFAYQWRRNGNGIGSGRATAKSAGLSATDEFWVEIKPVNNLACNTATTSTTIRSNSMWLSAPTNYSMVLSALNPICEGDGVRLTATPNVGFDFSAINLEVNFFIKKAGASAESEPTRLNPMPITQADPKTDTNAPTTYSYDVAPGVIENGDVVSIFFSTDAVKCLTSGDAGSFLTMQVNERPAIASQPTGQTACAGTTATFTVGATGAELTYQWYKRPANNATGAGTLVANGGRVSGAATASLSIANVEAGDAGLYYVVVGGFCPPTVPSTNAELLVNPVTLISSQPVGATVCAGEAHTFTVNATGVGLAYEWYKDGAAIPNQSVSTYTVSNATPADAGNYSVRVSGTCGNVLSSIVPFVVNVPPALVEASADQEVCVGKAATFSVTATGTNLTYQWQKGNQTITGATNSSYTIPTASLADAGSYTVTIAGACAPPVTQTMQLVVNDLPMVTVNNPTVCAGELATITAEAQGGSGEYEYIWTTPEGRPNPGNVASFATSEPGEYTVRVKDAKACESTQAASGTVTHTPRKNPLTGEVLAKNENGPITTQNPIAVGERVTFSVVSEVVDNGPVSYAWYMVDSSTGNWMLQPGENSATFVVDPVIEGAMNVQCVITPGAGNCYLVQELEYGLIIPLPVELLYFNATKRGTDVVLDWATASELDNKGFEVQVSSDARNFRALGFVESKVNTTSLKQLYTFVDKENGKQGVRYYRLKQVDLDGKFEFFNVRAVHFGEIAANKVKAYPNPFHSEVELSIDAELDGEVLITVTNATGQQLLQRKVQVARGTNTEKLVLDPNLPRGIYIISTRMGELNSHFKLLKQ